MRKDKVSNKPAVEKRFGYTKLSGLKFFVHDDVING